MSRWRKEKGSGSDQIMDYGVRTGAEYQLHDQPWGKISKAQCGIH